MSYTATNAAKEIVKQIATKLDSNSSPTNPTSILLGIINNSATPPTNSGMNQAQWDAVKAAFNLKNAQAPVDGWLPPAAQGIATTFQSTGENVPAASNFGLASTQYSFTPYCPRPLLVSAQISGYSTGTGLYLYSLYFDGTLLATARFAINQANVHTTFPAIQATISPSLVTYPFAAPQTLNFSMQTGGGDFVMDANDVISYAIS